MVKQSDQSVSEFYDDLKEEAESVEGVTDEQLRSIFILGLPKSLRLQVAAQETGTLNEALDKARLYEALLDMGKVRGEVVTNQATTRENLKEAVLYEELKVTREEMKQMRADFKEKMERCEEDGDGRRMT